MGHGIKNLDRIVVAKRAAWHGIGIVKDEITEDDISWVFDFELNSEPAYILPDDGGEPIQIPGKSAQVRRQTDEDGNVEIIALPAVMSSSFGTPDYEDRFLQGFDAIVNAGVGATCVSAGTLGNGLQAFVSFDLGEGAGFDWEGIEQTHMICNLADSVNGTCAFTATNSAHRVVCSNTMQAYVLGVPRLFSIRHTSNSDSAVQDALMGLRAAIVEAQMMGEAIERLLDMSHTEAQFVEMIKAPDMLNWSKRIEAAEAQRSTAQVDRKFDELMAQYNHESLAHLDDCAYKSLQAVQRWEQRDTRVRGTTPELRHMERVLFTGEKFASIAASHLGVDAIRAENAERADAMLAAV